MKLKARSRLRPNFDKTESRLNFNHLIIVFNFLKQVQLFRPEWWSNWWHVRQTKFPQLIIGLTSYYLTYYLINRFYPAQAKDLIWPSSYLSLIGVVGLGHLYLISFLTLRPRFSLLLSLSLSWLLWLKLHQFEINLPLIFISFSLVVSFELFMTLFEKLSNHNRHLK